MSYPVFFSFVPHSTSGIPFHVNTHIITVTDDEESHYVGCTIIYLANPLSWAFKLFPVFHI